MKNSHPQEVVLETFRYKDISVDLVRWKETIWCGCLCYEDKKADDFDTKIRNASEKFSTQDHMAIAGRCEPNCSVCMNINHIVREKPLGVMFAFLVDTENQPAGFDVLKIPAGLYMRVPFDNKIAVAIGAEPWDNGQPPFTWISENLAPQFGYVCSSDVLPVFEYYYLKNERVTDVVGGWLYVPVQKG